MAEERGRILVVDDNRINRLKLSLSLEQQGQSVVLAVNGRQTLDLLRAEPFDVVLLDMIMPDMDGKTTFEEMKKTDPGVRVLLSSGYSADGAAQDMLKLGVRGFVMKPYRMAELLGKIRETLGD